MYVGRRAPCAARRASYVDASMRRTSMHRCASGVDVRRAWMCVGHVQASTRARGDGGLRRAVASTAGDCEAQVVECCVGGHCPIRRFAVPRETRPTIAGSARVRVLPPTTARVAFSNLRGTSRTTRFDADARRASTPDATCTMQCSQCRSERHASSALRPEASRSERHASTSIRVRPRASTANCDNRDALNDIERSGSGQPHHMSKSSAHAGRRRRR
jgi:hypothetical protein